MQLFDTTFIVDLVNEDSGAVEFGKRVDEEASLVAISAISILEYLFGVYCRYGSDEELLRPKLASAENDLARFDVIPFTDQVANTSCRVQAELVRVGRESMMCTSRQRRSTTTCHW